MKKNLPGCRILLADDHIILRDALAGLINQMPDCQVIGLAADGQEVIRAITDGMRPNIIILDLNMPHLDGFDTIKWLNAHHPDIRILVLTMYDSETALIRILQEGVFGFLKKDVHPQELQLAIQTVNEGGYYYSNAATGKIAFLFRKDDGKNSKFEKATLSDTEIEFLRYASTDLTYKEIAQKMNLTTRVVDNYRDVLFDKLDVKSRVGLAIYAIRNGLVRV